MRCQRLSGTTGSGFQLSARKNTKANPQTQKLMSFEFPLLSANFGWKMPIAPFFGRRSYDPFSFDPWDPFFGSFHSTNLATFNRETATFANTQIDWRETAEAHIFKAHLPGLRKYEVKVEVEEGGVLKISGKRRRESEEKNDKWHRVERSSGKFLRRFWLPENAKVEEVKAAMENGVLTVTVPKQEEKKPDMKAIEISS